MPRMSASALQRALVEGRRGAKRYEIALALRFAAMRRGEVPVNGSGESVNISCAGMLFRCEERLIAGDSLVVVLDWPVAAQDNEPLKLVVSGHVVRTRRGLVAMVIHTHRLLRERDLDSRLSVFWAPAEKPTRVRRAVAAQKPVVLIEDDDTVALLVSLVVTPQNWQIERAGVEKAKTILESGTLPISLVVTRTPELLQSVKPETPAILTLAEDATDDAAEQIAGHPLWVALRRPLTDVGLRSLIAMLCAPTTRSADATGPGVWTQ